MKKCTLYDIIETFRCHNEKHGNDYHSKTNAEPLSAYIVYKQSNFTCEYTEKERTYKVRSDMGKVFYNGMLGSSMVGDCLDGIDLRVRLDSYDWDIEYCYFED